MARIEPLAEEDLAGLAPLLERVEGAMGFVPNSMRTMARVPGLPGALAAMSRALFEATRVDGALKQLVAVMASRGAGCRYCQAHTAHGAERNHGVAPEKIAALWSFETSERFDDAERAALRVALGAGQAPSAVTEAEFDDLKRHFHADQIAEIVGVISMFGFLNRWNDTLSTDLETAPAAFAGETLADAGWSPGRHGERAGA